MDCFRGISGESQEHKHQRAIVDFLDLIFFSQMCLGVKNFKKCWFICQFRGVLNTAINKLKFDINSLHEPILKGLR